MIDKEEEEERERSISKEEEGRDNGPLRETQYTIISSDISAPRGLAAGEMVKGPFARSR